MAYQTLQLEKLLKESGLFVEVVQVNPPYRPTWLGLLRGIRAGFRLIPYLLRLWRCAGRVDLLHVMANSGLAWHLFAAPAIWIAYLRRKPAIVNYRGGAAGAFLEKQWRWVCPTLNRASAVIVPSGFLQEVFAQFGVPAEIVPNVIDLSRFRPSEPHGGKSHIIVTRNLEDIYDIPTALRAFARIRAIHPDVHLSVAGSGPKRLDLEKLCGELGLSSAVTFTGRLDNDGMAALYRSADLLLNPALVDNMPNSLLEALASGVPIVSTNVGGISHLVDHGKTAFLVPPQDPDAMARRALEVLGDSSVAHGLRTAGMEAVAQYAWPLVRPRLFAVYARSLGIASLGAYTVEV